MADLEVSELQNPRTNWHTVGHGWLRRSYHPACQNAKQSKWGVLTNYENIKWFVVFFHFSWPQILLASWD